MKAGEVNATKTPVISSIAATGHKLQRMSKHTLIVNDWKSRCANWSHVVLSRAHARKVLFLVRPLALKKDFSAPRL